jgi:N-acyl-D-amino-acid deacylase
MQALLSERGFQDLSFAVVASYPPETSFNGLSIRDIALKLRGDASIGTQLEVAREMMRSGGADMVYHLMSEDDLRRIMKDRHVAVASDSSLIAPGSGKPHPRGSGNNARVLGRYVRELRVLSLEEAVRRMTSLPAQQFRLAERGFVRPGYAADIVLFDPKDVSETATYSEPRGVPKGIPHVMVNGVFVVRDGKVTGARPGQILRQLPQRRGLARPVTK